MKITLISTNTYPGDQGLRTISSYLKKQNHKVKIVFLCMEEDYSKIYKQNVLKQLEKLCKDSDLIGITSMASTSIRAEQVISYLKKLNKLVIWGGVHATISPEKCINFADIVCIGEGEEALVELCEKLEKKKDLTKIKNLWVKKNNKIIKNDVRLLTENLDKYPFADYNIEDHFILEKNKIIKFKERHLNGQIFYQTERGCPHSCTYCTNRVFKRIYKGKGKILRTHSINYIIKDLIRIKNKFKSVKTIDLRDETFFVRPLKNIKEFCEKYKKHIGIRCKCLADPITMDEEKLKLMINAGLTDIIIGIQGGNDKINLELYKRYIKVEEILRAAKILNKYKNKIAMMYDIITCNPYETEEDIIDMIRLLQKLPKPYFLSVNNLVFFIGSELYEKAVNDSIIKNKKDSAFDLNYWDRWKHIRLKKKNAYLNLILNLMRGVVTEKRFGIMPNSLINLLIKKRFVRFNKKHLFLTNMIGSIVQIADFLRENVAKPFYRGMPTDFKVWYDKIRYRV